MKILLFLFLIINVNAHNITIMVASKHEDVRWLDYFKDTYDVKIYRPYEKDYKYTTKYEKGNEACMYLSYIINNYYNLSDYTLFIHGHQWSWHSRDMIKFIPRIDWNKMSFNNINVDHHQNIIINNSIKPYIDEITLMLYNTTVPNLKSYCCSQFVVTRDVIHKHDIEIYIKLDKWLQNTNLDSYHSGRIFEYLWGYIFTQNNNIETYEHGLCDIFNCTVDEYLNKNMNFKLYNSTKC